jgi:8-oxo-dGTP diphosphatase
VRTKIEVSAGGVVFRRSRGRTKVCLIATRGGDTWQLPKGLVEQGEPLEEAAEREVREETGLRARVLQRLDKIDYWYFWREDDERVRIHKFVYFFLLRHLGGSTREHDFEVEEARWFSIEEAEQVLTFENEKHVLRQAAQAIASASAG